MLAIREPQVFIVLEQFGAENISLLSGRLVVFYDVQTQLGVNLGNNVDHSHLVFRYFRSVYRWDF